MLRTRTKGNALLVAEDDRQTAFVAEHDDLRVAALGQLVGDATIAWKSAMPWASTRLRFLPLSVEHEPHALGLLLGLQLFLDGGREQRRQRDRPEQDLLGLDSARREGGAYVAASGWSRNSSETSRPTLMPGARIRSETLPKKSCTPTWPAGTIVVDR